MSSLVITDLNFLDLKLPDRGKVTGGAVTTESGFEFQTDWTGKIRVGLVSSSTSVTSSSSENSANSPNSSNSAISGIDLPEVLLKYGPLVGLI